MSRKPARMKETDKELDRMLVESFVHNRFPDQQKAILKEIRKRRTS